MLDWKRDVNGRKEKDRLGWMIRQGQQADLRVKHHQGSEKKRHIMQLRGVASKVLQSASKRQYALDPMVQDKLLQERLKKQMQGVPVQGVPCPVKAEELQRKRSKGEERDEETQLGSEVCVLGAWKLQQTDSRHVMSNKWRGCGSFWRKVLQCQPMWR